MRSLGVIWRKCSVTFQSSNVGYLDFNHGISSEVGDFGEEGDPTHGFISDLCEDFMGLYNHVSSIGESSYYVSYAPVGQVG